MTVTAVKPLRPPLDGGSGTASNHTRLNLFFWYNGCCNGPPSLNLYFSLFIFNYAKNINNGDFVVVINTDKIKVTGKKLTDKKYYHYSGYHGGMKEQSFEELLEIDSTKIIKTAVSGMLPKNSLRKKLLSRLKIYSGPEHPHSAQINTK